MVFYLWFTTLSPEKGPTFDSVRFDINSTFLMESGKDRVQRLSCESSNLVGNSQQLPNIRLLFAGYFPKRWDGHDEAFHKQAGGLALTILRVTDIVWFSSTAHRFYSKIGSLLDNALHHGGHVLGSFETIALVCREFIGKKVLDCEGRSTW